MMSNLEKNVTDLVNHAAQTMVDQYSTNPVVWKTIFEAVDTIDRRYYEDRETRLEYHKYELTKLIQSRAEDGQSI